MTEIDALIDTLEMDNKRFAKSTKVMEVEEEWLKDVASSMMEPQGITVTKETGRLGELSHLRIDGKTIAKVMEDAKVREEKCGGVGEPICVSEPPR